MKWPSRENQLEGHFIPNFGNPHPIDPHGLGNQILRAKTARRHQAELQTANSTAAMAKLAGTATKFTQMLELSTNLQLLIRDAR